MTDRFSLIGRPDAPVVAVLGGISASRHVSEWWPQVIGDGRFVDTTKFRVLGIEWIDGGARPDGRPERIVTTHDQAAFLASVLDEAGIDRVHTLIGTSYGGMVGLAFADRYGSRVDQIAIYGAPARTHPMTTALRSIQRRIVELGLDAGRGAEAVAIARGLAMTTFRSIEEFGERFDPSPLSHQPSTINHQPVVRFPVEAYLEHQGTKFAARFSTARFLALSLSGDLHNVDPATIRVPALFIAAAGDAIIPREQMVELAERWGGPKRFHETQTRTGHDAFLAEPDVIGALLKDLLTNRTFV